LNDCGGIIPYPDDRHRLVQWLYDGTLWHLAAGALGHGCRKQPLEPPEVADLETDSGQVILREELHLATFAELAVSLCPITVKSAISQVEGVISVEVDQGLAQATVSYDDGQTTTDAIAAASTNAGYPATLIHPQ
jgi:mercuric ion binding protein